MQRHRGRSDAPIETPSLSDVAKRAKVSLATASRALSGKGAVRASTRRLIEKASEELGYVLNGSAQALAAGRTRTVGAIVPSLESTGFVLTIAAFQRALDRAGFTLLLGASSYDRDTELREARALLSRGVDGLMVIGGDHHPDLKPLAHNKNVPLIETWTLSEEGPCVGFDNAAAAARLTRFLLDLGHTRIAVIAGRTAGNDRAAQRVAGIRTALAEGGLTLASEWLIERPYRILDGRQAMRALLSPPGDLPTAVICGNDQLAFGALIEARSRGMSVPDDISVVGFNDLDYAAHLSPPLTTIRVETEEIGRAAGEYLIAVLAGEKPAPIIEVEASLVVRGSTAPPPHRAGRRGRRK